MSDVQGSLSTLSDTLSRLKTRPPSLRNRGLSGVNGAFTPNIDYGFNQLPWLHGALHSATTLTEAASEVAHPDMELTLLRMTGPRLQAALSGALLLAVWVDFLNLADVVLRECPTCSVEGNRSRGGPPEKLSLFSGLDVIRSQGKPVSVPYGQILSFLSRLPALRAQDVGGRGPVPRERLPAMKLALPRLPPAAPAMLGTGLVVGSSGLMMGSQVVVSAEWVEMMRRLVQAGVLSASAVSAAVRIHAGMMVQTNGDLPEGVREALGEGPEVSGMHVTGRAGAGMGELPKHHVLPREHREWFEKRGFTGDMDIDQFCVRMERAQHEAIHGGGDWRLGRTWPDEWNQMIMRVLREAEHLKGWMLTRDAILKLVAERMKQYDIPMNFTPGRGP